MEDEHARKRPAYRSRNSRADRMREVRDATNLATGRYQFLFSAVDICLQYRITMQRVSSERAVRCTPPARTLSDTLTACQLLFAPPRNQVSPFRQQHTYAPLNGRPFSLEGKAFLERHWR